MKILFRFIFALIDRLILISGVLLGAQIPLFMQQYIQRLAGHVSELNHFIANLNALAAQSHKTLHQYIEKFELSIDSDFAAQGAFLSATLKRQMMLDQALQSLLAAPFWQKPYYFLTSLQYEIAKATLEIFQPGLSLTLEGASYMVLGGLITLGFYYFLLYLFYSTSYLFKKCIK